MEEAGIAADRTEAWGWIQESCILGKWCHICAAEANFSARTGYIQGHDCLFADKKKTVPLRSTVFIRQIASGGVIQQCAFGGEAGAVAGAVP